MAIETFVFNAITILNRGLSIVLKLKIEQYLEKNIKRNNKNIIK